MSSIKIIDASQARNVTCYKSLKRKILKYCANICFNKQCLQHNLTPQYTKITVPITSPAAIHTQRKVNKIPIKDEIKFQYLKKEKNKWTTVQPTLTINIWLEQFVVHNIKPVCYK